MYVYEFMNIVQDWLNRYGKFGRNGSLFKRKSVFVIK